VGLAERKHWLMRIARGEWVWPGDEMGGNESDLNTIGIDPGKEEFVGCKLVKSRGARRVVEKLLVRDPRKRARIVDLWEDEWMLNGGIGVGGLWWREQEWCRVKGEHEKSPSLANRRPIREKSPSPPVIVRDFAFDSQQDQGCGPVWIHNNGADGKFQEGPCADGDCESMEGDEEEEEGCLFDQEGIDSITRQEVL
jgi:protein-serine/threonine kinase